MECILCLHTHLRMRLIHFPYDIQFDEALNPVVCLVQFIRWRSFGNQFRSRSASTIKISVIRQKNCRSKMKRLICDEGHSYKGCPNREAKIPKCANCKGPHVASYKGCPDIKSRHSGYMWSITISLMSK